MDESFLKELSQRAQLALAAADMRGRLASLGLRTTEEAGASCRSVAAAFQVCIDLAVDPTEPLQVAAESFRQATREYDALKERRVGKG